MATKASEKPKRSGNNGGGRREWEPTDKQRKAALVLVAQGATIKQVAANLGVSKSSVEKHLSEELKEGWEFGNLEIYGMLWKAAKRGNVAAIIFLAKNRLGMTDRQDVNHSGSGPAIRGEIALRVEYVFSNHPQALPPPSPERMKNVTPRLAPPEER